MDTDTIRHIGVGVAAAIAAWWLIGSGRRLVSQYSRSMPVEHRTRREEQSAKSALRTLQRYLVDHVGPEKAKGMSLDEIAATIQSRELMWPEPRAMMEYPKRFRTRPPIPPGYQDYQQ